MNVKRSLRRLLEQEDEPFSSNLDNPQCHLTSENDDGRSATWVSVDEVFTKITWTLVTEYRSWGIAELRPRILSIDCHWTETTLSPDERERAVHREFHWDHSLGTDAGATAGKPAEFDVDAALGNQTDKLSFPIRLEVVFDFKAALNDGYLTIFPSRMGLDLPRKKATIYFSY